MKTDTLIIGKTYTFWLGGGFTRRGRVLEIEDGMARVKWEGMNGHDYVRCDAVC